MDTLDRTIAEARALAYQAVDHLLSARSRLFDAARLGASAAFDAVAKSAEQAVEDVLDQVDGAANELEGLRPRRQHGADPPSVTARVLGDVEPGKPDLLSFALLVNDLDVGIAEGWQSHAAEDALVWLLRQQPDVVAALRDLVKDVEDPKVDSLGLAALRRP